MRVPPMWTPNTTARAEGASKAIVTQFKVALTKFKAADSIADYTNKRIR